MFLKKEKEDALKKKMLSLNIQEKDLVEKFILGSGRGGQKIQKTHSCVYLKHKPTGIAVKCQKERSRAMNRYFARKELTSKIEEKLFKEKSEKQKKIYKIKKQKKRRSKKAKLKMIEEKRKISQKKALRKKPSANED
ncbi:MAG: Peptide chain release factor 1 [Candidatus Anoxychlamydiales bacterium]|nr:Peptide chain release factor 1 [Candidatus Anoxychlamydiales bacterium]NGX35771.1 Peptide chain release factor 1 [Candidatus Anoxychlamydiales bacterium]